MTFVHYNKDPRRPMGVSWFIQNHREIKLQKSKPYIHYTQEPWPAEGILDGFVFMCCIFFIRWHCCFRCAVQMWLSESWSQRRKLCVVYVYCYCVYMCICYIYILQIHVHFLIIWYNMYTYTYTLYIYIYIVSRCKCMGVGHGALAYPRWPCEHLTAPGEVESKPGGRQFQWLEDPGTV